LDIKNMKKYSLTIFSSNGNINTSIVAASFNLTSNYLFFYDSEGELICGFPANMTSIISISKNE